MTQNGIVGPETPLREIEGMASQQLPQAGTDLALPQGSEPAPRQSSELAPRQSSELALSEAELARKNREEADAILEKAMGLSIAQLLVLEELGRGRSVAAAARKAQINAGTIYRWMRDHAGFIRHHQTLKRDLHAGARSRLDGLLNRAIDAVDGQITRGDGRLGLEFLREMKVTPKSNDVSDEIAPAERSETVVEMVQQRLSVTTNGLDTKTDAEHRNRNEIVTKTS